MGHEHDRIVHPAANETQTALALVQFAKTGTKITLNASVIQSIQ